MKLFIRKKQNLSWVIFSIFKLSDYLLNEVKVNIITNVAYVDEKVECYFGGNKQRVWKNKRARKLPKLKPEVFDV